MENKTEIIQNVVAWIRNYAATNGRQSLVVGVSGGIDSALVSTLSAMTGITTICVSLPCHSRPNLTKRADNHIDWLKGQFHNVTATSFNLDNTFESFQGVTPAAFCSDLAFANTKSRLRMTALYQVATSTGGIVIGTGNRVEDFGVGFFTKYGDGGVDLSPIADFTKTEVRELSKELGILEEIVTATPTDGLWEDMRSDEQQLGASYEELEWAMVYESLPAHDRPEVTARQYEVLQTFNKWNRAAQHKLKPIPTFKR
jgi:NAD+ synthase